MLVRPQMMRVVFTAGTLLLLFSSLSRPAWAQPLGQGGNHDPVMPLHWLLSEQDLARDVRPGDVVTPDAQKFDREMWPLLVELVRQFFGLYGQEATAILNVLIPDVVDPSVDRRRVGGDWQRSLSAAQNRATFQGWADQSGSRFMVSVPLFAVEVGMGGTQRRYVAARMKRDLPEWENPGWREASLDIWLLAAKGAEPPQDSASREARIPEPPVVTYHRRPARDRFPLSLADAQKELNLFREAVQSQIKSVAPTQQDVARRLAEEARARPGSIPHAVLGVAAAALGRDPRLFETLVHAMPLSSHELQGRRSER